MDVDQPRLLPSVLVPEHAGTKRTTRDWIVDVWCFLAALVIGAIAFAAARRQAGLPRVVRDVGPRRRVRRVPRGVAAAPLAARRWRSPLTLLAVVSSGAAGAAVVALFTLAVHRPFRQAAPVAALALAHDAARPAAVPRRRAVRRQRRSSASWPSAACSPGACSSAPAASSCSRCATARAARRDRAAAARRAGAPAGARADRARDARRARPPDLAAEPARRGRWSSGPTRRRRRSRAPPA